MRHIEEFMNFTENIKFDQIIKAENKCDQIKSINKITNLDILNKIIELNFKVESFNYNIIYFDIFLHISLILFILFSYLFVKYEYSRYNLPYKLPYKNYPESKSQV